MVVTSLVSGLNSKLSLEWTDESNWFFACWYKFTQRKGWLKVFGEAWPEMDVASLVMGLENWLYLKNEQME